jgi:transposase
MTYKVLGSKGYKHQSVSHGSGEYVKGNSHTNSIESFWSRLKNSVKGTHVHVSKKHLEKYAKEFEYRFNSKLAPISMFPSLISKFSMPSN